MPTQVIYDGSFEGWLSAVFAVYELHLTDPDIVPAGRGERGLFACRTVETDPANAKRVMDKLKTLLPAEALKDIYRAFLSEKRGMENVLFTYITYALNARKAVDTDFSHPAVLATRQTAKQVHREKHRMEAFVRFQLTQDGLYYAFIEPDFNVLPLIADHFRQRYADQRWMIYDGRRKWGIYYDGATVTPVEMAFGDDVQAHNIEAVYHEDELFFQEMWQKYFQTVNIKARKNIRLHIQHMPRRYWRNLVEKKPDL